MRMVVALYIGDSSAGAVSGVPNTAYPIPCTPQKYPHRGMTDGPVHRFTCLCCILMDPRIS